MLMADVKVGMRVVVQHADYKGRHGVIENASIEGRMVDVRLDNTEGVYSFAVTDLRIEHTAPASQRIFQPGDVVYMRSNTGYDVPMVVKEVQSNSGYLGVAWLDASRQISTWFAPADCFMQKPDPSIAHREDLNAVRHTSKRGDW